MDGQDIGTGGPNEQPLPGAEPAGEEPRRKRRAVLVALLAVVALAAIGAGMWIYLDTAGTQRAAVALLDEATALVESADVVVLDLDEIVRAEIDSEVATRAADVADRVPDATRDLERAIELIGEAQEDLPAADVAYALALRDSAAARLEMLEVAEPILDANIKAGRALGPSTQGWALLLASDELSAEAAQEYSKLTEAGVRRSTELATEAAGKVQNARDLFSEAATAFPEIDFAAYDEFCEKKLAALDLSKQADAAWLARDIPRANALGTRYNEAEQELSELADDLPSSPAVLVAAAFEELAADPTSVYFEARARATAADARLRRTTGQPEPEPDAGSGTETDTAEPQQEPPPGDESE